MSDVKIEDWKLKARTAVKLYRWLESMKCSSLHYRNS